jgi:hypothetical protein
MTFHSPSLVRHLRDLEQQIASAPQLAQALQAATPPLWAASGVATYVAAKRLVETMAVTTGHISAQVVPGDQLGVEIESLSELVLRASRMVVLAELAALGEVVSEPCARDRRGGLLLGRFELVEDWICYVARAVNGIAQGWLCYRGARGAERAAYRAALRTAHEAMRWLGEASDAAPFLRQAVAHTSWPALQEVSSRILIALTVQINVEPDEPILVLPEPSPGAPMERVS